ncbi:YutD family protein [Jeotgalibaca sp. MA1X17-3]|uniref:YutD family protein n=1 Tax=Jeotgalibaca sp. MA1X17-3 TaxID=2908211 RepID=UPI001F2C7676|nr:YutD family protein [Jeotgalibaca sp. MA1X17-3]UJF14621.1 YutD family protein [Jeotgalibaca sp. MA1X17-3]
MLKKESKKEKKILKEQIASKLEDITTEVEEQQEVEPVILNQSNVTKIDDTHVKIENQVYEVVVDYRDAFQVDAIVERHNSILNKYDYIVGDWGYDQLRLKGFFDESNNRAPFDKKIDFLEDYLFEFCNFGCAYFVLEKEKSEKSKKSKSQRKKKTKRVDHQKSEPQKPEAKKTQPRKTDMKNDSSNRKVHTPVVPKQKPSPSNKVSPKNKKETPPNQSKGFVIKKTENKKPQTQVKNNKTIAVEQENPKADFKIHTVKDEKNHK